MHNILLIQSERAEANAVRESLRRSSDPLFRVVWVKSCANGLRVLARQKSKDIHGASAIAAILVDLTLPDSGGMTTFDQLFQAAPRIPMLVLTSAHDEEIAKAAVQRGASEYLLKQYLDAYLLPKAVGNMIERAVYVEALFEEKERAQVTLNSIGDAVVSTDVSGQVTFLNIVAEDLTGWSQREAVGRPLEEVFRIIDGTTRADARNPMTLAISESKTVGLTPNCVLIRRDGVEFPIEDSAAPIHDRQGQVTGAVMVFHDVSAARALSAKMSHLAQHDSLTDLPNRILLNDRLSEAISSAHRYGRQLALLFVDVDRFKPINDSLGHSIGDLLLQSIAKRLLTCVRASDTVSRQGGDEFVILLTEVSHPQDATVCADKILNALRCSHRIGEHDLHVTASIGIVTYPDDGTDSATLMKNADFAMYHAKECGRDNRQFFKQDLNVRARKRQSLENSVRSAFERDEFTVHYQPTVNLQTGKIVAVEALIRWRHPELGLVPPAEFIPMSEDCGLIVPISRWVLREASHQARAWQDIGIAPIIMGINISAVELRTADFIAGVGAALSETGLAARFLEFELTETFLMQDATSTLAVLNDLKALGLRLALDDFGTGYSSLSHLKRFPIDTLKIDRSFVQGVTTNSDDASIVGAVVSMGNNLNMRVVAEGVESREQLAFLQDRECQFGQGFYFCRPMNGRDCTRLLRRGLAVNDLAHQSG